MAGLSSNELLMNPDGLVVNAFRDAAGRGDYFSGSSGTSEGQFLFILGMLDTYVATKNTKALELAERALSCVLVTLYRNTPIPDVVTEQKIFAPHWLFAAKYAFNSSVIDYDRTVTFANGVGTIPLETVRYVYNARSMDGVYLWQNPYSSLTAGTLYPVASYAYVAGVGMRVTLATAYTGPLKVTYSSQTGPTIAVGEPYEAWPDWRKLDSTEIDAACDVFIWAYRAFHRAYEVTGNDTWNQAARATLQQAAISIDLNDGRDWVKPTWTDSPFADGARFSYVDRSPPPGFGVDNYGRVQIDVPTRLSGTGDVQYGKASIGDVYAAGDQTTVEIESNKAITVRLYIDQQQAYAESRRYYADLALSGNGAQTFTLTRTSFKNSAGTTLPVDSPVYTAAIQTSSSLAHTLWIKRIRQTPPRNIQYYPGAIPFTANFMGSPPMQIDWRGPIYAGYQAPPIWMLTGKSAAALTCTQLLVDAQTAWVTQTGKARGPFAPVFYFNRDDAVQYGTVNTFGWEGPDPNTKWGGYQYRPLAELAEALHLATSGSALWNLLVQSAQDFLHWLATDSNWLPGSVEGATKWSSVIRKSALLAYDTKAAASADQVFPVVPMGPPTDFPKTGAEVNYPEPHMTALILRAMVLLDTKLRPNGDNNGALSADNAIIMDKCLMLLDSMWVETGVMAGTFSNDPANHEWYGFWHGEISTSLTQLLTWASRANVNITTKMAPVRERCMKWLGGMTAWAETNSPLAESVWGEKLWPFDHDWASAVSESFEFSTNIITAFDGSEQRISRRNHPRRALTLQHTLLTQKESADYHALLRSAQNRPFLIPQWHLAMHLSADAAVGQSYIDIEGAVDPDLKTGSVIVLTEGRQRQVNYVALVSDKRITLRNVLQFSMRVRSRAMSAYMGLLNADLSASRVTSDYLQVQLSVTMLPQEDRRKLPVRVDDTRWVSFISAAGHLWSKYIRRAATLTVEQPLTWPEPSALDMPVVTFTVDGEEREVITRKPNWISDLTVQDQWVYDVIDYFSGPVTPMDGENTGKRTVQARWSLFTSDDQYDVLAQLGRLRGMQMACWLPSGTRDFVMTRDTVALNRLYVQNNAIIDEDLLLDSTVGICLHTRLNSHICVRATSFTKGNTETVITLDRDLPWALERDEVAMVSLLYRVRQASDRAEISWLTPAVAELQVSFVTVQE